MKEIWEGKWKRRGEGRREKRAKVPCYTYTPNFSAIQHEENGERRVSEKRKGRRGRREDETGENRMVIASTTSHR